MRIGMSELVLIFLIILVLFGAQKLPEIGQALGKALKEFKKAGKEFDDNVKDITQDKDSAKK